MFCRQQIMSKKTIILEDLKNQLTNYFGNDLIEIYLFGSQATNSETLESDYDILILTKGKINWKAKDKVLDICYYIDLKYDILIDPHIIAEEELSSIRGKQPIISNAIRNGISV